MKTLLERELDVIDALEYADSEVHRLQNALRELSSGPYTGSANPQWRGKALPLHKEFANNRISDVENLWTKAIEEKLTQ